MKITLNQSNSQKITLDVAKIISVSGINLGVFKVATTGGLTYEIKEVDYNRVLDVLGTANGESSGSSGGEGGLEVVNSSEREITLEPNKYYIFGECETLNISIGEPTTNGRLNEYRFEFDSGATPTVLTLPNTISPSQIEIQEDTKYVISIKNNVLTRVGTEYSDGNAILRSILDRSITKIDIPTGCQVIPAYLFQNCSRLTSVILPEGITDINAYVFNNCTALQQITLPSTLTNLAGQVFYNCTNLKSIVIPEGITIINSDCFRGCRALESVTFPSHLTTINATYAFASCQSLRELNFPSSLTYIGARAFEYNYSLTEINLPENVSFIGDYSFQSCTNVHTLTLPDNLTVINQVAFADCRSITPTVILPSRLVNIGTSAFLRCYGLTYIEIPNGVTTINNTAFQNCSGLSEIEMYDSITTIGTTNAFQGIKANARVRIYGTTRVIPFLSGIPATVNFYVEDTMVQTYKTNSAWSARASYIHGLSEYTA